MQARIKSLVQTCLAGKEVSPKPRRPGAAPPYHRGSKFINPVPVMTDRNLLAKLLWQMRAREQQTRVERREKAAAEKIADGRKRARPVHRGEIGDRAIEIFRVLLFELPKLNGLHPTHETLMKRVGVSKPTLISAIKRIVKAGFLTVYRRIRRLHDGRVVQTSNSYEPHPKGGLGALEWSGLKNNPQHQTIDFRKKEVTPGPLADLFKRLEKKRSRAAPEGAASGLAIEGASP